MTIYDKSITNITTRDLQELLDSSSVENIRLEFKQQDVSKDEYLKKLSAFANTFGGYLVVGAEADNQGRLRSLPGINPIPGFKQRIVQWCYDGIWPPLTPHVSEQIDVPEGGRSCYVIYVEESALAPHFLNGRKGAYVRTDEFSQRYEPQLATLEEVQLLSERRRMAETRRELLSARSKKRFDTYVGLEYGNSFLTTGTIGATLHLEIAPLFPVRMLADPAVLSRIVRETTIAWRSQGFPWIDQVVTQHETCLLLSAGGSFSFLEVNQWGHLHYAKEVENEIDGIKCIHTPELVGHILVFNRYVQDLLRALAYDGSVWVSVGLEKIRGIPFLEFPYSDRVEDTGRSSTFDRSMRFELTSLSSELHDPSDELARKVLQTILFALNWAEAATRIHYLDHLIATGYQFNRWPTPTTSVAS